MRRWQVLSLWAATLPCTACERLNGWLTAPEVPAGLAASLDAAGSAGASFLAGATAAPQMAPRIALSTPPLCQDLTTFCESTRQNADPQGQALLAGWRPPQPPSRAQRRSVEKIVGDYLARCALPATVALASELIALPTVADGSPVSKVAAFVSGKKRLANFARAQGLAFSASSDGRLLQLSLGEGPTALLFLTHLDVVGGANGWSTPPFSSQLIDGRRLQGRGALDNKGPMAAALVVMQALSRAGLAGSGKVALGISMTGESDTSSMESFFARSGQIRRVLALDGRFPSTVGEQAQAGWYLAASGDGAKRRPSRLPQVVALAADSGPLQLPQEAQLTLKSAPALLPALQRRLRDACARLRTADGPLGGPCTLSLTPRRGMLQLSVRGKVALASAPKEGRNAIALLATLMQDVRLAPNGASVLLRAIATHMSDHGAAPLLKLQQGREEGLVVEPTALHFFGQRATLDVSLTRPDGVGAPEFRRRLAAATTELQRHISAWIVSAAPPNVGESLHVRADAAFLGRLRDLFLQASSRHGLPPPDAADLQPQTLSYPSLMRTLPGAVGFGPLLPRQASKIHGVDESIDLQQLQILLSAYYAAAVQL